MKRLTLGDGLTLPADCVTQTFAALAVRGAGKSNLGAVMAEEMFAAGLPFVAIDPVGSWRGLRSGGDGQKDGGLPIPIFGGRDGDLPLQRGAGETLADLIAEQRLSCVIDLTGFESEGDKKAFLLAFARRLYLKNENPLHLFLEEADDYIPQRPMRDEAQLLRAWENIVRRGRARGLGVTLITQRSAAINKAVLTQVETLFVLRTTGPQDIAAIEAWVQYHQVDKSLLRSLAGLENGEAWVWSPHYLKRFDRVRIRRRRTFDTGATPKNLKGTDARPVATLADVDLTALRTKLASASEQAKAEDPRELRKRIAELERQVKTAAATTPPPTVQRVEVPVIPEAVREQARALDAAMQQGVRALTELIERHRQDVEREARSLFALMAFSASQPAPSVPVRASYAPKRTTPRPSAQKTEVGSPNSPNLGKAERAILTVLAQHPDGCERGKLTLLAGYRYSGGFRNSLSTLRSAGLIEGGNEAVMRITD
ncbi:MAG: ATP-binding protein, partial [Vicinamibacterales bacterium]